MRSVLWPEHFACFCGNGHQWWDAQQKAYRCNAPGCTKVMVEDRASDMIGVWNGHAPGAPMLSLKQARERAPAGAKKMDLS